MKISKKGISTITVALTVVLIIVVIAAAAYIAVDTGKSTTVTATTTKISTSISTSVTTSISTSVTTTSSTKSQSFSLDGAGSTFVYPLMSAWITQYTSLYPNIQINYQSIGSGAGITDLEGHTVDYAASDAPLQAADQAKAPKALTIPDAIGSVTVAYNLPHIASGLNLTGAVMAQIFAGNITKWNDPAILSLQTNATLKAALPNQQIIVVHRSDSSGTSFTFTGFLTEDSAAWAKEVGQAKAPTWPTGYGANGNAGVAGFVQGTHYTMGYVELAYALTSTPKITVAAVQNPAGDYVLPTQATSAAAATALPSLPAGNASWASVNLLNQAGAGTYPIVTFTYIFVYQDLSVNTAQTSGKSAAGATALVQFLWWVVTTGQQQNMALGYVPLPQNVVTLDEQTIQSITYNGQSLLTT
ncbi:MAG: phosphate ABC transporter substrate-binding protein PstS [Nitrososphaerales archaeon]|jgi:phosphate ABC transporter phosphate-binding protein